MQRMFSVLIAGLTVGAVVSGLAAQAAPWPEKAYTATYENTSAYGSSIRKVSWDGHGHGRTETKTGDRVSVGIIDAPSKKMTMILEGRPPMTLPWGEEELEQMGGKLQSQITGRVDLGTKLIDGHLCTGQRYSLGTYTTEAWTDKELGMFRLTTTTNPAMKGTSVSKLTSYSAAQPDASLFKVPGK